MTYTMNLKIRYSECDAKGRVSLHQILNYFQDCATLQSEEIGYGLEANRRKHRAWFLLAYDIRIDSWPRLFQSVRVITDPYLMKGHYGYRRFMIEDEEGKTLVRADSIWILMNTDSLLPTKIPEDMSRAFVPDPSDDKPAIKRKIRTGKDWEALFSFPVTDFYLDSNQHVNNTWYAAWVEKLSDFDQGTKFRIDYRKAAFAGDSVYGSRQIQDSRVNIRLENQKGEVLAYIQCDRPSLDTLLESGAATDIDPSFRGEKYD